MSRPLPGDPVLTSVMLMISIQLTGQGVVEEKSNRIVEILLAAVKPWELLAGVGTPFTLLSLIPFFSPVMMPMRAAFGVPGWEIVAGIGIMMVAIVVATWLAGKVYRSAVLRTGSKVSLRNALRGSA